MTKLRTTLVTRWDSRADRRTERRSTRALAQATPAVRQELEIIALRHAAS